MSFYSDDHKLFRDTVRTFVERNVRPAVAEWEAERFIDHAVWRAAGAQGILGIRIPVEFGGAGIGDYRFRCVVHEELAHAGAAALASGWSINEDIVSGYLLSFGTPEQQREWLPGIAAGRVVTSIAMSEPGTGSDLRAMRTAARRVDGGWLLNGAKTFITNGFSSDLVLVAARTDERDGRPRLSLFLVPSDAPGFRRGRKLRKLGLHAQDTAELVFEDVLVPAAGLVGEEHRGFHHLTRQLPLERLSIAWRALASAEAALAWTIEYTKTRTAFGQRIIDFQHSRFQLAELSTQVDVTRAYLERAVERLDAGDFGATDGAKAKWWSTELQRRVTDACLQLHGGYGYMEEYPISRAFADARASTIVGGTTEIMKEIIGRDLAD